MSPRTRRAWSVFAAVSVLLVAIVAVLTVRASRLERRSAAERRAAAVEADVRLALWRMDTLATSILVEESARSIGQAQWLDLGDEVTTATAPGDDSGAKNFVKGRFEIARDGNLEHRGQLPQAVAASAALSEGNTEADSALADRAFQWATTYKNQFDTNNELADKLVAGKEALARAGERNAKSTYEYAQRQQSVSNAAKFQPERAEGYRGGDLASAVAARSESFMAAAWVGEELFLLRRVQRDDTEVVQGVWLDADGLGTTLTREVADLFPRARLQPVMTTTTSVSEAPRRLAALPLYLAPGSPALGLASERASVLPLVLVWLGVIIVLAGSASLLAATLGLSDRRAAFVTAVTHELRTPLTTLRTYAEMLGDPRVTDEGKRLRYLDTMQREAVRLGHLVENVLAYSQIEQGKQGLRAAPLELSALLERAQPRLAERAAQGGLTLQLELPEPSLVVLGEAMAVEQILFNLVDNAAKYARPTTDTALTLSVTTRAGRAELRVADRGRGIPLADRRKIFAAFSKSAQQAAISAPGVGLGLALCRRLAQQLGGELELDETHAPGTAFVLRLKTAAAHAG